ncbi:MAG: membrane protein [Paracoccaceae bacterium]
MTQYILAPFRFLVDWLVRFIEDDGLASAGYLAYIGLMSLLPFLVFVFTLLGLIGRADEGAGIVDMMFRFMPTEVALTLQEPVVQVVGTASGGVLTLSLVVVLWIAASGVEGIRSALNRAYRTRETRSYWRRRANSSVLVIFFSGFIIIAIGCMVIGPILWQQAEGYLDFGIALDTTKFPELVRFGAGGGALFIATAALYHALPNRKPSWIGVLPGAGAVFLMVTGATSLYSLYLEHFAQYTAIYGSLGGIISTLIFFYLLGAIFVLGAELNGMLSEVPEQKQKQKQEGQKE